MPSVRTTFFDDVSRVMRLEKHGVVAHRNFVGTKVELRKSKGNTRVWIPLGDGTCVRLF